MRITPASAAVIIGLLALLGVLAYLKVEGAAVAAVGAIGTLVAWLSQPPKKDRRKGVSIAPDPDPDDPSEVPTIPPPPNDPDL